MKFIASDGVSMPDGIGVAIDTGILMVVAHMTSD